jgi:ligand-binding sensor domain-containing protein
MKRVNFLPVLVIILIASCNGQVETNLPKDTGTKSVGQPKLVKTQGTNQYANIHCGLQDKAGNLWFGTNGEGVYRFDGKSFIQFTKKDGLSSNIVYSILEDKTGSIWIGTDSGICRYDGKTISGMPIIVTNGGNFYFNNSPNNPPSIKNAVWSMMQDKSGKLWFGTTDGVYCYNGTFFTHFLDDNSIINKDGLQLKMVDCILEDKKGIIWFGSGMPPGEEGVCRYDGKSITSSKPNGDGWIRYMLEDKNGNIWFSGRLHGVFRYDGKNFTNFTEKEKIGAPILEDKAGNIWFAGEENGNGYGGKGGVWCYDGKSFKNFTTKDGMGDYGVWCIIEDRAGNIWFGTRNTGLYRYDGKTFTGFSE